MPSTVFDSPEINAPNIFFLKQQSPYLEPLLLSKERACIERWAVGKFL